MAHQASQEQAQNNNEVQRNADQVEIVFYTDPLCCWSWAFEPQWRKLRYEFEGSISWRYCMGGLIPSWTNYNDVSNNVTRPIQMGPIWMEASHNSGMPINNRLWVEDPPASSYPACIAFTCANAQSFDAGEKYLRMLREAVMMHGKNISKEIVLTDIAQELALNLPRFNTELFKKDLTNGIGLEAFRKDLSEIQTRNVTRFPSLILRKANQPSLIITGYRPYEVLLDALSKIAPGLQKTQQCSNKEAYLSYWGTLTQREMKEALTANNIL